MKINRKMIQIIVFVVILVIGIVTIIFNLQAANKRGELEPGDKAPAFQLIGLESGTYDLSSWNGKYLVINFWGTFCPPCRNEMPALQRQANKWKSQSVEIVGISVDKNKVTVENFVKQLDIQFPILLDLNEQVRLSYGVMYYPTTFFVLPNGKIAHIQIGEMTETFIDSQIQSMLKES